MNKDSLYEIVRTTMIENKGITFTLLYEKLIKAECLTNHYEDRKRLVKIVRAVENDGEAFLACPVRKG